jgi:hypothetical protein
MVVRHSSRRAAWVRPRSEATGLSTVSATVLGAVPDAATATRTASLRRLLCGIGGALAAVSLGGGVSLRGRTHVHAIVATIRLGIGREVARSTVICRRTARRMSRRCSSAAKSSDRCLEV